MLRVPSVHGLIARRILANYRVDPQVLAGLLPPPFRPKLINGMGIAGICLIRLQAIRPQPIGGRFGLSSENAAHRIAVQWTEDGIEREGVFVPRRDTSSRLNTFVGGNLFPGIYNHAQFDVMEQDNYFRVALDSDDGQVHVLVAGRLSPDLPSTSTFSSLQQASDFFEAGSVGYSVTRRVGEYDRLELRSYGWKVEPLVIDRIESSFFDNEQRFPKGSLQFDCALIMTNIQHEWHSQPPLCCSAPS